MRSLQRDLNSAGYKTTVNSVYGSGTTKSVKRFEIAHNLKVDGIVTPTEGHSIHMAAKGGTGGTSATTPASGPTFVPGSRAQLSSTGYAIAPADAPAAVKAVIHAANHIAHTPYKWGGGHGQWQDSGYDCSGSVSYALHGGNLLHVAEDSSQLEGYGYHGRGRWITIYANSGHTYAIIAGLRFDTSGAQGGSRWQRAMRSSQGYVVRHPAGF